MTSNEEIWKIIPEFPAYRVSNYGKIQTSYKRIRKPIGYGCKYIISNVWKTMTLPPQKHDYIRFGLYNGKPKPTKFSLHRLVAELFLPKPQNINGLCVRHLDNNTRNNTVNNLMWGTYTENTQDIINQGRWVYSRRKLTLNQVEEIRKNYKPRQITQKTLALKYKVHISTIVKIINRYSWKNN